MQLSGNLYFLTSIPCEIAMGAALDVIKQAFEAFGRRDIPAFLNLVADEIDWKLCCPTSWPISGLRRNPAPEARVLVGTQIRSPAALD
jgi:ketosteroid isomerase-like protein